MRNHFFITGLALSLCLASCIKKEALNVEAAIDDCEGLNIQLVTIHQVNKTIDIYVSDGADISQQELIFKLPEGATAAPLKNEPNDNPPKDRYDFSQASKRKFIVTSEDKCNKAEYDIGVYMMELPTEFSFEDLAETAPYHILYLNPKLESKDDKGKKEINNLKWASANPGYKLTGMANTPTDYPTTQYAGGTTGRCIKLETKATGGFGEMVNMPIAAGNLFVGTFNLQNAVQKPLDATRFGYPFKKIPVMMTGYFKFKAGQQMNKDEKKPVLNGKDRFDIYAVMYEAEESSFFLDGNVIDSLDSPIQPNIVRLARFKAEDAIETSEWTRFDLPFETKNGKSINEEDLKNGKYKLGIVLSSSIKGGHFEGAIGSTLWVDELKIICETDNQ